MDAVPKALTFAVIQQATRADSTLQSVISAMESRSWDSVRLKQFVNLKEVSVYNSVVLRSHRIVIPESLRGQPVELAHLGHQGIVKTKSLIRETVCFPGIDQLEEENCK